MLFKWFNSRKWRLHTIYQVMGHWEVVSGKLWQPMVSHHVLAPGMMGWDVLWVPSREGWNKTNFMHCMFLLFTLTKAWFTWTEIFQSLKCPFKHDDYFIFPVGSTRPNIQNPKWLVILIMTNGNFIQKLADFFNSCELLHWTPCPQTFSGFFQSPNLDTHFCTHLKKLPSWKTSPASVYCHICWGSAPKGHTTATRMMSYYQTNKRIRPKGQLVPHHTRG